MKIKILGQDPSMLNWGLVAASFDTATYELELLEILVVQKLNKGDEHSKRSRKSFLDLDRSRDLHTGINAFLAKHDFKFTMVEVPHGSQSASSMKGYGICLGILGAMTIPMVQLSERECKINAIGKPSATKKEMIDWAMNRHPDVNWKMRNSKGKPVSVDGYNEHASDAVGALEAGIMSDQFNQAMSILSSFE
jgi:hypothetical protein